MTSSRFFLNHRFNDSPERQAQTGGDEVLSTRFCEGMAGGSVMLGSRTCSPAFEAAFGWPDVGTPVAYDEHDTAGVLANLSSQPDRLAVVRTPNVRNSLRRHHGAARWSQVPGASGLPLTPPLQQRIVKPRSRADTVYLPAKGLRLLVRRPGADRVMLAHTAPRPRPWARSPRAA